MGLLKKSSTIDGRNYLCQGKLRITGTADATTVTLQMYNLWEGEALAAETVDSDTPTGGTRFDVAATGLELTIKGLTKDVRAVLASQIIDSDMGQAWDLDISAQSDGTILVRANVQTTGAAVDFRAAGFDGLACDIQILYLAKAGT